MNAAFLTHAATTLVVLASGLALSSAAMAGATASATTAVAATKATATAAPDAATMELGRQLFISGAMPACAVCHTLKDADAEGAIGPVLDEIKPSSEQVVKAVTEGLGVMPAFKETLTEVQIKALAAYVSHVAGKP